MVVFDDPPEPVPPDAVFPNNWVAFHPAIGSASHAVMFPMMSALRRQEIHPEWLDAVAEAVPGRAGQEVVDLTPLAAPDR